MSIVFKGTLDNGDYLAMNCEEYMEHKAKEYYTNLMRRFEKVANNPILSEDVKNLMWIARCNCQVLMLFRDTNNRLRKEIEKNKLQRGVIR